MEVREDAGRRAPAAPLPLPVRDVRRRRPPALSFLLRLETARRLARVLSLLVLDFVGVYGAIWTALVLKAIAFDKPISIASDLAREVSGFAFLLTVLLFARYDLYADRARRPGGTRIASALAQVTLVALVYALADGQEFSSYYTFYGSLFFAILFVWTLRRLHSGITGQLLGMAGYRRRALLVGTGGHIDQVAHALADQTHSPVDVVGFIALQDRPDNGLRSLGRLQDLPQVLDGQRVQEVIIADPDFPQDHAVELADLCHSRGVTVHVAPSTMEILLQRATFTPGQSVPLFTLKPPVFDGFDYFLKRSFDLVASTLLLVVLAPVLLAIAIAVRVSSSGGVLYRSMRPGIGGELFPCLKFRTMCTDADQRQADLEGRNEASGPLFKIKEDPRVTPVGGILRRFSLDELPQLVNVLRGEMSLVGPRPLPVRDFDRLEDWHKKRYGVLPGMTGLWQVSGRSELDFDELVRLDFLYLERWSVWLDVAILLKTVPAVALRRGAF